jgi:hypothetical protein
VLANGLKGQISSRNRFFCKVCAFLARKLVFVDLALELVLIKGRFGYFSTLFTSFWKSNVFS